MRGRSFKYLFLPGVPLVESAYPRYKNLPLSFPGYIRQIPNKPVHFYRFCVFYPIFALPENYHIEIKRL